MSSPLEATVSRQKSAEKLLEFALKAIIAGVLTAATYALIRTGVMGQMMANPVVFCLMLDAFLIHVCTHATRREAAFTGLLAALALALWILFARPAGTPAWQSLAMFGFLLGLASLFVLSIRSLLTSGTPGRDQLRTFGRSSVFLAMTIWSIPFLIMSGRMLPEKLDLFLYRFDASFGLQPSFLLGQVFAAHGPLNSFSIAIYGVLALPAGLVYIGHLRRGSPWPVDVLQALLLNAVVGYLLFWLFPAAGPVFAFPQGFPFHPPEISSLQFKPMAILGAVPNAMPSVHVSTALLVWFNSRPWPWARVSSLLFALTTILATLGLGEHYVVDIVVAFPYALFIQSLSASTENRNRSLLLGLCLTAGWLVLLRFGSALFPSPVLAYPLSVATVAVVLWRESRLAASIYALAPQIR